MTGRWYWRWNRESRNCRFFFFFQCNVQFIQIRHIQIARVIVDTMPTCRTLFWKLSKLSWVSFYYEKSMCVCVCEPTWHLAAYLLSGHKTLCSLITQDYCINEYIECLSKLMARELMACGLFLKTSAHRSPF